MSFIYHCPHCQDAIECPDEISGQICQCPTCKKEITPHPKEGVNSAPRQNKQFEPPMYCLFAQNVAKLLFVIGGISFLVAVFSILGTIEAGFLIPSIVGAVVCFCIGLQVKAQAQFHLSICQINFNLQKIVDHLEE